MENPPPPAEELALIDAELRRLDARRSQLLTRRAWLLAAAAPPAGAAVPPSPAAAAAPPRAEASPPGVRNVLLTLGGTLLAVAAIAFTLLGWGSLGIGGRSAVLGAVTLAALGAPLPLLRRGLPATAEAVCAVALVLTALDAYAVYRVVFPGADPVAATACACALLAGVWTAQGLLLPGLRTPLPAAVCVAQPALPLWALSGSPGAPEPGWALLLTAAGGTAAALLARRGAVRGFAGVAAALAGAGALAEGLRHSLAADTPGDAAAAGPLLLAVAATGLLAAWRAPSAAVPASAVSALAVVAAVGGVVRAGVPEGWSAPGYLLCAALLAVSVRPPLPPGVLRGACWAATAVHALAVPAAAAALAVALAGPTGRVGAIWEGAPATVREALPGLPAPGAPLSVPVVLAGAAVLPALLALRPRALPALRLAVAGPWRGAAAAVALVLGWAALAVLPWAVDAPYLAAVCWQTAVALGALAAGARSRPVPSGPRHNAGDGVPAAAALLCAAASALSAVALALATRTATFAVLGVLTSALAAAARRSAGPVRPAVLGAAAVLAATGLAGAAGAASGLPAHQAALVLLAVPAAAAGVGGRLGRHPAALPVELASVPAGAAAVLAASGDAAWAALALALCGVIAAATALRPERRPAAAHLAAGLFLVATWVRLFAAGTTAPEPYTLPVTVAALVVGALRRRRDPGTSSWRAYGPGLAATAVPALLWALVDEQGTRPLLLGSAALVVTLVGARRRLQAPLLVGGGILVVLGAHELAPYVVQAVGALPRWLPPALAGALLLGVGATYEQRLREVRRMRAGIGRMR
ncbi:SCO7613 C-terminal domain-containing membrane protein [Streptomyces sp. NPDC090029]|uniref:SCO7613 C-terminal domain-containing membrane protein n=1 Tax=Streptomyces sp. NPDC090029 TaxID=3365924 RepID=UPI003828472D